MAYLQGTNGDDTLNGQAENDTLVGYAGTDRLEGGDGNDFIVSRDIGPAAPNLPTSFDFTAEVDTLLGDAGDDVILAGYNDIIDGGSGTNLLSLNLGGAVGGARLLLSDFLSGRTNLAANGTGTITNIAAILHVTGSAGADAMSLFYQPQAGSLNPHTTILGLGGNDTISSGFGTDSISGGDGDDSISGFGAETIYGDAGSDTVRGTRGLIYGGDGDDILIASARTDGVATIYGGRGNDGIRSESAIATSLYGEEGNDGLTGGSGDDSLYGGLGADLFGDSPGSDLMVGDVGNDIYFARTNDRVVEGADEGADVLYALDLDYTLPEGIYIETLTSYSQYLAAAQKITGNSLGQEIIGDQGANVLTGSALATLNADTFRGLGGGDTLIGNGGADLVDGGDGADVMIANAGDDTLLGGAGDDTLNGGIGRDRLEGGAGNDVYLVDDLGDVLVETPGNGTADTVYSVNNFTLNAGAQIENFAGATATSMTGIALTGNEFGQAIAGTYGNDTIKGGGSSVNGGDILIGLRGDDSYVIDAPNILIFELFGVAEGNDTATILASGSGFTLNGDSYVEALAAQTGTDTINITGNFAAQRIVGNDGNNLLSTGGAGADTLDGGLGDDTYRVHGTVQIADSGGNDAIYTSGTFRLFSSAGIELITAAVQAGTEAIDVTGNDTAQTIIGNYGTNVLDGRGGNDTLIGLQGADTFAFTTAPGAGNIDTIQDFASGTDRIGLASDVFAAVTTGGILANEFVMGSTATTADTRLIYNQTTGQLFYDADANGSGAAVLFAQLGVGTTLSASDFVALASTTG